MKQVQQDQQQSIAANVMLQKVWDKTRENLVNVLENLRCQKKTFVVLPEDEQEEVVSEKENEDELKIKETETAVKKFIKLKFTLPKSRAHSPRRGLDAA